MKFVKQSHRNADIILCDEFYSKLYKEVEDVISSISDDDIRNNHLAKFSNRMSLSHSINDLLSQRFVEKGWSTEVAIFQEKGFKDKRWRLDFAKDFISIEVAFNHGEAIAWNLIKPVLASEQNHVEKAIQTKIGIVICATAQLKERGAFDGAVGEFEKFCRYLLPLNNLLTVPMLVIGLSAPETFRMEKMKINGKNIGVIVPEQPSSSVHLETNEEEKVSA